MTARFLKDYGEKAWDEIREKRSMAKPTYEEIEEIYRYLLDNAAKVKLPKELYKGV